MANPGGHPPSRGVGSFHVGAVTPGVTPGVVHPVEVGPRGNLNHRVSLGGSFTWVVR